MQEKSIMVKKVKIIKIMLDVIELVAIVTLTDKILKRS